MKPTNRSFIPFGGYEVQKVSYEDAEIIVLPFCYENSPSYGTGSADGPYHLLEASEQLECLDEEVLVNWGSFKIFTETPLIPDHDPQTAVLQMKQCAKKILADNKFLLCLGGDHAITIGPVSASSEIYPNMGVLQVDAHLDLRNEWNGSRYNHACVMRRIADDLQLPIVQVGIRCISPEEHEYIQSSPLLYQIFAHEIHPMTTDWIDRMIDRLPENIYLTIDLDGLDPSVIPGTGTPVPGGLTYRQLIQLIRSVGNTKRVIAGDITELVKIPGNQVSEFTAAKIASKIFIHCWNHRNGST